jgi:hypothetical protein
MQGTAQTTTTLTAPWNVGYVHGWDGTGAFPNRHGWDADQRAAYMDGYGTAQADRRRYAVEAAHAALRRAERLHAGLAAVFGPDSTRAVAAGHEAACAFADYRRMVDGS